MKKRCRENTIIPTGSMADIAFLLLIFFLVTATITDDSGIMVKLPPWDPDGAVMDVNEKNVLNIYINSMGQIMVEHKIIDIDFLDDAIKDFILNPHRSPSKIIISLKNDRSTSYTKYIEVYDGIKKAYSNLRNEKAFELFSRPFDTCTSPEKKVIRQLLPMVISEMEVKL